MRELFSDPALFWYGFVFLFLFFGTVLTLAQCRFLCRFSGLEPRPRDAAAFLCFYFLISTVEASLSIPPLANDLIYAAGFTAYLKFIRGRNWSVSALSALSCAAVLALNGGFAGPVLNLLSGLDAWHGNSPTDQVIFYACNVGAALIQLMLNLGAYELLLRKYRLHVDRESPYMLAAAAPLMLMILLTETAISAGYGTGTIEWPNGGGKLFQVYNDYHILFLTGLEFFCLCAGLYSFQKLMDALEEVRRKARLEQLLSVQRTYLEEAASRIKTTRAFRHDLNNHLRLLKGFLDCGETERASAYLEKITETAGQLSSLGKSGNAAVDILLEDKLAPARRNGIHVVCDVLLPENLPVEDFDLTVLFANALDNALAACGRMRGEPGWIDVKARRNQDFLLIDIVNSRPAGERFSPGTGLENIRATAGKYRGTVQTEAAEGTFTLTVLLQLA